MKRILFYSIAAVGLILTSCSNSKRVHDTLHTTTAVIEQADLRVESHQTTETVARTETESIIAESEETHRIELEFDTTRPIDSVTGLPPVKRITITDHHSNRATDTRQQRSDTLKQQTEITIQDSTRREIQTETIAEHDTQKKSRPRSLPWLLVGLVLVAFAWAAWKTWGR